MHAKAWAGWVLLVMVTSLTTTNPYYLGLVLLCVLLVAAMAPRTGRGITSFRALLAFGAVMFLLSGAIGVINGNYGDHLLFTIPGKDLPDWLGGLRLGGPVSGEGVVATTTRGLAILCVLLAFGVFNSAVSPHAVLRSTPAALKQAGLVLTIGLTLLPSSIEDLRRIREMRALRGARGGLRELPALVVPAVIGGLERSMRLAEAMEARGYGAAPRASRSARLAPMVAVALLLAGAWAWFYYENLRLPAIALALGGLVALGWWVTASGRGAHTTALVAEQATLGERAAAWASLGLAAAVLISAAAGWNGLKYNPFADFTWPRFEAGVALFPLATAWPALWFAMVGSRRQPALHLAPELSRR